MSISLSLDISFDQNVIKFRYLYKRYTYYNAVLYCYLKNIVVPIYYLYLSNESIVYFYLTHVIIVIIFKIMLFVKMCY